MSSVEGLDPRELTLVQLSGMLKLKSWIWIGGLFFGVFSVGMALGSKLPTDNPAYEEVSSDLETLRIDNTRKDTLLEEANGQLIKLETDLASLSLDKTELQEKFVELTTLQTTNEQLIEDLKEELAKAQTPIELPSLSREWKIIGSDEEMLHYVIGKTMERNSGSDVMIFQRNFEITGSFGSSRIEGIWKIFDKRYCRMLAFVAGGTTTSTYLPECFDMYVNTEGAKFHYDDGRVDAFVWRE